MSCCVEGVFKNMKSLYLDTENTFSSNRILNIIKNKNKEGNSKDLLNSIISKKISSTNELMDL
jgi:hypothetical protein